MAAGNSLRLLRSPLWLLGAVVALAGVVAFVGLGFWQLDRLDQRRALNERVESRASAQPVPLTTDLLHSDLVEVEYLPVVVDGVYDTAQEVILQARSLGGISGHHVVTPLRSATGVMVAVNRGWVPIDAAGPPVPDAAPPSGRVMVTGILRRGESGGLLADTTSTTNRIGRLDLDLLANLWDVRPATVYLELQGQEPRQPVGTGPVVLPQPDFGEGPHLSYAMQWFAFATIVLVGFPVLMIRAASRERADSAGRAGDARSPSNSSPLGGRN